LILVDTEFDEGRGGEERSVGMTTKVNPEPRMLIDGELVESSGGRTFANLNPATEEELGQVADATSEDMQRAIAAARRAFDETDWSTNRSFRRRCLEQLHEALDAEREEMREQLILEAGCPRMLTSGPQLDAPLDGALTYPAQLIDEFAWVTDLPDAPDFRGEHELATYRPEGTGRGGRGHRPLELPVRGGSVTKLAQAVGHREHRGAQTGPRYPVERHLHGPGGGRAHRHSTRGPQHRHLLRSPGR
jgi:hypothetical protein